MEYFKRAKNCIRAYTHVYMCVRRAFACLWATKNSVCFSVTKEEFVLRSKDHVYVCDLHFRIFFGHPSSFFGKKQKSSVSHNEKKAGVSLY